MRNQLTEQEQTETVAPPAESEQQQSSEEVRVWLDQIRKDTRLRRRLTAFSFCLLAPVLVNFIVYLWLVVAGVAAEINSTFLLLQLPAHGLTFYGHRLLKRGAIENIAKLNDVRYAGALVEVLNPKTRIPYPRDLLELVGSTLIRLLPRLKASDSDLLNDAQRSILLSLLGRNDSQTLQVAILESFKQIGDARCLPVVERLAGRVMFSPVPDAAKECLPYLKQRVEEQTVRATLLRAGSAPSGSTPETLLRPAQGADVRNEPALLLRAAAQDRQGES